MQAVAAELSGYAGKFRCFWREECKNSLLRFLCFKTGSQTDAQPLFESFLARNELVASVRRPPDVILRASAGKSASLQNFY
jgi:hypothetical protein